MYKERITSLTTGAANDLLYWNYGGTTYDPVASFDRAKLHGMFWGGIGSRGTLTSGSDLKGWETMRSTSRGKTVFNDCQHWKSGAISLPYTSIGQGSRYVYWQPYFRTAFPTGPVYRSGVLPVTRYGDGTRARAWWHMQPRFEGEVQLMNFLFELKDFRDLAKLIQHPSQPLKLWKGMLHPMNIRKKQYLGRIEPSGAIAEAHLMYQFAVKPLLKDIAAIGAQIALAAEEAQKSFLGAGDISQKSHYTEQLYFASTPMGSGKLETSASFTATMQYRYRYRMRDTLAAFARYWGLTGSAEAFWNMIPLSFIADYFATIGKSIHAMTTDPNVDLLLLQYCESTLTKEQWGIFAEGGLNGRSRFYVNGSILVEDGRPRTLIAGYESTMYVRTVCSPYKGPALPKLKLPSSAQALNLLALARCFV